LHAHGSIYLRQGSAVYGRLSAGQSIRLDQGCAFQRMHAPQILTVGAEDSVSHLPVFPLQAHVCQTNADAEDAATDRDKVFLSPRPRIRIQGNFVLPAGETLNANVIATGEVRFGPGAHFFGNAKSYKDTIVEEDACVHGSIVCEGTVHLGPRCFVTGPVIAEGNVLLAQGSRVGTPDALTTLSSSGAKIAAGCQLHGTVWVRVRGYVEG
jgi:cytoskeletal protein CcmA (bactofilin family)